MKNERGGPGIPRLDGAVSKEAMLASGESERALAELLLALTCAEMQPSSSINNVLGGVECAGLSYI